jgi:hypothetical protein
MELPGGQDGRCRRRRGGFPTRKAAEKTLARLRMPADAEALVMTGEWLDRWLEAAGTSALPLSGPAAFMKNPHDEVVCQ